MQMIPQEEAQDLLNAVSSLHQDTSNKLVQALAANSAKDRRIAALEADVSEKDKRIAELEEKLNPKPEATA